jgi:hypothetical protein
MEERNGKKKGKEKESKLCKGKVFTNKKVNKRVQENLER